MTTQDVVNLLNIDTNLSISSRRLIYQESSITLRKYMWNSVLRIWTKNEKKHPQKKYIKNSGN